MTYRKEPGSSNNASSWSHALDDGWAIYRNDPEATNGKDELVGVVETERQADILIAAFERDQAVVPGKKLFLASFNGTVHPEYAQECPFTLEDFKHVDTSDEDVQAEFEEIESMSPGDSFDFTERQIIKADTIEQAREAALAMIEDWHMSHWTDCQWSIDVDRDVVEITSLEDVLKIIPAFNA